MDLYYWFDKSTKRKAGLEGEEIDVQRNIIYLKKFQMFLTYIISIYAFIQSTVSSVTLLIRKC